MSPAGVARIEAEETARVPLGRRGRPTDIAAWIVRLADPHAAWVTLADPHAAWVAGQIAVDSGLVLAA